MNIPTFLAVVGFIFGLAVLLPFVQGARRKATLDLVQRELDIERDAREAQEVRCSEQIAELRGQLQIVNERFAVVIAREVVKAMRDEGVLP